jgi:hypothetical protein
MALRGRPTLYRSELCSLARDHCRSGASNDQLAALFGVAPRSIDNWIARIPDFAAAVNEGRAVVLAERARQLFRRAIGYTSTVERVVRCRGGGTTTVTYTKHHLPETRACHRYLCIRRPQNWRPRPDLPPDAPQNARPRTAHQFGAYQASNLDDAGVAEALYQRAVGYRQTVERLFVRNGKPILVTYIRLHPPQFQACAIWLSNRRPQDWRPVAAAGRATQRSVSRAAHQLTAAPLAAGGALNGSNLADPGRAAVAAERFHQREEAIITTVAVLATENGTEERAKSLANQAVDLGNGRHDSTPKWVREMSRNASPIGTDRNVLNSHSLRHKPAGFHRSMRSEGATGIVWATARH